MFPTRLRNVAVGRTAVGALVAALLFAACQGDSTTPSRDVDLTIAKTHTGDFTQGGTGSYTITVSNDGTDASSGTVTVTDVLPTGLSFNAAAGAGWTCAESPAGTMTCTRTTAIAAGGDVPAITLTVNVGAAAVPSVTNTVTVAGGGDLDGSNNSDADATTVIGLTVDLTIAKTHVGDFTEGTPASYSITVSNEGTGASTGTITVTDALPTGETYNVASGTGWTCEESPIRVMSCTSAVAIAAAASAPAITLTVDLDDGAVPTVTNTATVSGGGDLNAANNSDDDLADVIPLVSDLTITKTHTGPFIRGTFGTYTITVSNGGTKASSGTITVTDELPAGLNFSAAGGTGWTCGESPARTMSCTSADPIAIGASAPDITLLVTAGPAAVPAVTNTVTVAGGGEIATGNDSSSDPTTVQGADLTIAKTHTGDFTQGTPSTYTITVSNGGTAPSSGTITVTDALPPGLTFNAATGTGWTCSEVPAGTMKCTTAASIATSASAPAIQLTVNVGVAAVPSVTNTVTVAGGLDSDVGNNSSDDPTTVNPPATDHFIGVVAGNNGLTRGRVAFDILEDSSAATGTYNINGNSHAFTSVAVGNGQVVATDGNLTFTGAITDNDITGDFSGGLVDGLFTAISSPTPTGAIPYCGAHIGYSNLARPAAGVFAFVRRGATVRGAITTINGRLHGFVTTVGGNLLIDTVNATTSLAVVSGNFTGSYNAVLGDNALLSGSVCPSSPPSPTLSQIAGVFGTNSPTTNNAFGSMAVSLSSNGVGSSGTFTDSTGVTGFDQVISGPGNRVFMFTAGRPFLGTLSGGSLTGDSFDATDKTGLFAGVVRVTGVPVVQYCGNHSGSLSGGGSERGSFAFLQIGTSGLSGVFTSDNVGFSPGFVAGDAGNDAASMGGQSGATVLTDALGFSGFYDLSAAGGPSGSLSGTLCPL